MRFHLVAAKSYLAKLVIDKGAKHVLTNFDGTNDEAVKLIMDDPRDVFTIGPCDHQDALTGRCLGHESSEAR
jgi:hypothetical protein